jgi:hypothetical protein
MPSAAHRTSRRNAVNVPTELFQLVFVLVVTVLPIIVLVRLAAGDGDLGFDALIRADTTLPWPKGVQEEEPKPWRFGAALG